MSSGRTLNSPYLPKFAPSMRFLFALLTVLVTYTAQAQPECDVDLTVGLISCAGADDGSLTVVTNSGGPFTYVWDHDATIVGPTATGLGPGFYSLTVEEVGVCISFLDTILFEPSVIINGVTDYCPSAPPVLTAEGLDGMNPIDWAWTTADPGDTVATINIPVGTVGPVDVTVTDANGCVATASVNLVELPTPTVAFVAPDTACQNFPVLVQTLLSTADSLVWRWAGYGFSNLRDPTISFTAPGWQPVSLQGFDLTGCGGLPVLDSIYIEAQVRAIFTAEQIPCTPTAEILLGSVADSCAFFIGDSLYTHDCSGFLLHDFRRYIVDTLTFYTTQANGCNDTLQYVIDVRTEPTMFLANAFTPNEDGINDLWPARVDIPKLGYELRLFDRWGSTIWETDDPQEQWDGSLSSGQAPLGVYIYTIKHRDPCSPTNEIKKFGHLTVFR